MRREMDDEVQAIAEYKARAEDLRHKAQSMHDPEMRRTMAEIAADYETMVATLQLIHHSKQRLKRFDNSDLDPTKNVCFWEPNRS